MLNHPSSDLGIPLRVTASADWYKPIELPPAVARRFVDDMRAFRAEPNAIKADEIAVRQLHALKHGLGPQEKLRLVRCLVSRWDEQTRCAQCEFCRPRPDAGTSWGLLLDLDQLQTPHSPVTKSRF